MPRGRGKGPKGTPETGAAVRDAGEGARKDFPAERGGAGHGTRKKFRSMQQASPQRGRQSGDTQGPQVTPTDVFGPTMRPNEPVNAGIQGPTDDRQFVPKDPDIGLKMLYQTNPHPDILALLNRTRR